MRFVGRSSSNTTTFGIGNATWSSSSGATRAPSSAPQIKLAAPGAAGVEQTGADAEEALRAAYAYWINDSFWLNPVVKFFDPGVERSLVKLDDGRDALLISYTSGGGGLPATRIFGSQVPTQCPLAGACGVQIIPIGGIETTVGRMDRAQHGRESLDSA